ncbi:hypothetical protein PV08_11663 [Exophiala spinifera]|uniref:Transcription factor domain-containing protein n=1 Tax=Exophiala spinifera TaxID=91928 RepID=A0A0D2BH67_9EURO|nr:uncharacterized protein PV08_11663 [Exophiala spinifera]KIW10699.1 hypothetical protein PV08_11663 [Exophiala spinifera]
MAEDCETASQSRIDSEMVLHEASFSDTTSIQLAQTSIPASSQRPADNSSQTQTDFDSLRSITDRERDATTQGIVETALHDDTDALHLLFDATSQRTPRDRQPVIREGQYLYTDVPDMLASRHTHATVVNATHPDTASWREMFKVLPVLQDDQIRLWARFPPCIQRIVSPQEVLMYIEYFFVVLNKQMPIISDWFHNKSHHEVLMREESILCYSILTISSRLLVLPGHNGRSRGYLLHDHFFKYVQEGIQSLLWGLPLGQRSGISAVGAIESLILLTQWVGCSRLTTSSNLVFTSSSNPAVYTCSSLPSIYHGQEWRFLNPAQDHMRVRKILKRAQQQPWHFVLILCAATVAAENGLYDKRQRKREVLEICQNQPSRLPHIQQILYIYTSHLVGRLKRPNPLAAVSIPDLKEEINAAIARSSVRHQPDWQPVLNGWLDLVELGQVASQVFCNPSQSTTKATNEGKSLTMVRHFTQALSQWWENFETLTMPKAFRCNMEVEYQYLRILIQATILQSQSKQDSASISRQLGVQHELSPDLRTWSQEISTSCCTVYDVVAELHEMEALRAITAPLLLRIVTVCMFGLKVLLITRFAADKLLSSLIGAIVALRSCSVDDLHLAKYYAQLLEHLVEISKIRCISSHESTHSRPDGFSNATEHMDKDFDSHHKERLNLFDDPFPIDWDDWLAYQFDPALANMFEFGDNEQTLLPR